MEKAFVVVNESKSNTIKVMPTAEFADNYAEFEPLAEADTAEEAEELSKPFRAM